MKLESAGFRIEFHPISSVCGRVPNVVQTRLKHLVFVRLARALDEETVASTNAQVAEMSGQKDLDGRRKPNPLKSNPQQETIAWQEVEPTHEGRKVTWQAGKAPDAEGYAAVFEKRAFEYDFAMQLAPRARDAEFEAVIGPLLGMTEGLVCDMPAGGGYLAAYLPDGFDYVAVEPASNFLTNWPSHLKKIVAGLGRVQMPDSSVDYLVSLAGLHHEFDLRPVFGEMRRLVRSGGRVVIADAEKGTEPALFLNGFVADNNPLGHDGRFFDENTRPLLEDAGFEVVEDQLLDIPWSFDSLVEAGEFCRHLFGTSSLDAQSVADALDQEIGFDWKNGKPRLKWKLRRFICDAA